MPRHRLVWMCSRVWSVVQILGLAKLTATCSNSSVPGNDTPSMDTLNSSRGRSSQDVSGLEFKLPEVTRNNNLKKDCFETHRKITFIFPIDLNFPYYVPFLHINLTSPECVFQLQIPQTGFISLRLFNSWFSPVRRRQFQCL